MNIHTIGATIKSMTEGRIDIDVDSNGVSIGTREKNFHFTFDELAQLNSVVQSYAKVQA